MFPRPPPDSHFLPLSIMKKQKDLLYYLQNSYTLKNRNKCLDPHTLSLFK